LRLTCVLADARSEVRRRAPGLEVHEAFGFDEPGSSSSRCPGPCRLA